MLQVIDSITWKYLENGSYSIRTKYGHLVVKLDQVELLEGVVKQIREDIDKRDKS